MPQGLIIGEFSHCHCRKCSEMHLSQSKRGERKFSARLACRGHKFTALPMGLEKLSAALSLENNVRCGGQKLIS